MLNACPPAAFGVSLEAGLAGEEPLRREVAVHAASSERRSNA